MATPRKHWFRVADSIGREDWPRDVKATFLQLGSWLNTRWARDGLSGEAAYTAVLDRAALVFISGRSQRESGLNALRALAERSSLSLQVDSEVVTISWRKYAEFQGWLAPELPESLPRSAPSVPSPPPPPQPPPQTQEEEEKSEPAARLRPLLNLISKQPGTRREKELWLEAEGPLLLAEAEDEQGEVSGKSLKTLCIRFYRQYSRAPESERQYAALARKEAIQPKLDRLRAESAAETERRSADPEYQRSLATIDAALDAAGW